MGADKSRCGWLKDKFGLSWQIVATMLGKYMSDPDSEKSKRVVDAIMKMDEIDIETLTRSREGRCVI